MRLIDADDLLKDCIFPSIAFERGMRAFIGDAPTIEAVPVVRGEWVPSDMQEGWVTCSVCKKMKFDGRMALSPDLFEEWGLNFCPNCGAKMGEGEDDETD